jgi:hypothetical protein
MFDQEIADFVRTGRYPDLIPYVCQNRNCQRTTCAPAGLTAIVCDHCGHVDTGTELARQGWRNAIEARCENKPDAPKAFLPVSDIAVIETGLMALVLS